MKKIVVSIGAAAVALSLCADSRYNHTSYSLTGLVVQYDGLDNGEDGSTLVNLGSAGAGFNMVKVGSPGDVAGGIIPVGSGNAGWYVQNAQTAVKGDGNYTVEYVGAQSGCSLVNGYCYVIGADPAVGYGVGFSAFRIASGGADEASFGCETYAEQYKYEGGGCFANGGNIGTVPSRQYATRSFVIDKANGQITFYENGVALGTSSVVGTQADAGISRLNIGDMRATRGYGWWQGGLKNVRIYTRALSAQEIAANHKVDGYRFYGVPEPAGMTPLTIASSIEGIGAPSPVYGTSEYESGTTSVSCSAGEAYFKDGVRYVCSGYVVETSTDNGLTWIQKSAGTAATYTWSNDSVQTRITWQWVPSHYRLYVTKNGGEETFSFSPAVEFEDALDPVTAGGYFPTNATVTVSATTMTEPVQSTFTKWTGDAEAETGSVAVTMDGVKTVKAVFSRPWYKVGGTLYYGDWTVPVVECPDTIDGVATPLMINKPVVGSGVLDLSCLNRDLVALGHKPVMVIGESALKDNTGLTGVVFPTKENGQGIVRIDKEAFGGCISLRGTIDFWSIKKIDHNAFNGCSNISCSLVFPALTEIGDRTFKNSGFSGEILAPQLTTFNGEAAFTTVKATNVVLSAAAVWPKYLFYGCPKLERIVASPNFTKFGSSIFTAATFPFATIELPGGAVPEHADATFEAGYDWKLAIVVPESKYAVAGWSNDGDYVALDDAMKSKANYDRVSALRYNNKRTTVQGSWANKWLLTYADKYGCVMIVR